MARTEDPPGSNPEQEGLIPRVEVYTDGSCVQGYGGWALSWKSLNTAASQLYGHAGIRSSQSPELHTTANRMELQAIIDFLSIMKTPTEIMLYTDSTYVLTGLTCGPRQ